MYYVIPRAICIISSKFQLSTGMKTTGNQDDDQTTKKMNKQSKTLAISFA